MRFLAGFILLSALCLGQTCAPVSALRPVDSLTGALTDADCRLSDGSLYTEYVLTLPAFGQLQLTASSGEFPVTLFVRDSAGRKVAGGAAIQQTVERGEFTVLVNAQAPGQMGTFTLASSFTPEPNTMCRNISRIGPNQSLSGRLVDSSCRLLNNTPYDGYLVTISGSGTLDVSLTSPNFSGLLTLRGDDGRELVSDSQSISASVLGDTDYRILVSGADPGARGDYSLVVKFTPADEETCRSQKTLVRSEDVKGSIGEDSCSFGTDLLFAYYDLTITAAGFADLRALPSGDISALVAILDRSGRLISQDLESGGRGKPILRQQLPAGSYTVLVIMPKSGGDYTLQYRFTAGLPAACPVLDLRPGAQTGALAGDSSCHSANGMEDVYSFSTAAAGTLEITLSSDDFRGSLLVRDAKDNTLLWSHSTDTQDAHIAADLPAGTYSLSVLSIDPGSYTIDYNFTAHDPAACSGPRPLALNSASIGALGAGSCRGPDGQPADTYEITIPSPGTVALFMTSADLDSYLSLADSQGSMLRRDDNSYGAPDAMILQWLPAGTYRFDASASGGSQSGRYRVDVLFVGGDRPSGCLAANHLLPGDTRGTLYVTSCQYVDDTFADIYRVTVREATTLNITLASARFDAYLELLDDRGNVIDQDGGSGVYAQLGTPVEAGDYYVVAKPIADQGYVDGPYILTLE